MQGKVPVVTPCPRQPVLSQRDASGQAEASSVRHRFSKLSTGRGLDSAEEYVCSGTPEGTSSQWQVPWPWLLLGKGLSPLFPRSLLGSLWFLPAETVVAMATAICRGDDHSQEGVVVLSTAELTCSSRSARRGSCSPSGTSLNLILQ